LSGIQRVPSEILLQSPESAWYANCPRTEDHASPRPQPPEIASPLEIDSTLKPTASVWGHESFLTQGDILQVLGDSLVTRSDTFVIRAYGESLDRSGKRKVCAWCEVVVQRVPAPVQSDATGIEPKQEEDKIDFGRQFRQIQFRWLSPAEI